MNIEQLKQRRSEITDRKSTEYKICTLLIGECETVFKRTSKEPDIVAIASKMIKSNNEMLSFKHTNKLVEENIFLQSLLPEQMSEEELITALKGSGATSIGEAMKYLNNNYAGKFDRKLASQLAKNL